MLDHVKIEYAMLCGVCEKISVLSRRGSRETVGTGFVSGSVLAFAYFSTSVWTGEILQS